MDNVVALVGMGDALGVLAGSGSDVELGPVPDSGLDIEFDSVPDSVPGSLSGVIDLAPVDTIVYK